MARTYKRDANGRFAGGGGSTRSGRPAAKPVSRGKNRITRDNAGRIASVGGEGATARGGRLRTAAGNKRAVQTARIKGAGGKLRKPVGGGQSKKAATTRAATPLTPSQVQGQRRRASEKPVAFLERAQTRNSKRLQDLQSQKSSLETSLRRRRGKLDETSKKAAAASLSKTNRRISRLKDAEAMYRQKIGVAKMTSGMRMDYRTGKKAPATPTTDRNRLDTLRRRVSYLRKEEPRRYDAQGMAYAGPGLAKARKDLSAAVFSVPGQRVSFRSRGRAVAAQRAKSQKALSSGRTRGTMQNPAEVNMTGNRTTIAIGTSRQGDLLTGGFSKTRTGKPRPRRR
jgi:hypothetical protein